MEILGFFPWRPGVSPEDQDEDNRLSQWEYAGNHSLDVDSLKAVIETLIRSEVAGDIDTTVLQVRIRGN